MASLTIAQEIGPVVDVEERAALDAGLMAGAAATAPAIADRHLAEQREEAAIRLEHAQEEYDRRRRRLPAGFGQPIRGSVPPAVDAAADPAAAALPWGERGQIESIGDTAVSGGTVRTLGEAVKRHRPEGLPGREALSVVEQHDVDDQILSRFVEEFGRLGNRQAGRRLAGGRGLRLSLTDQRGLSYEVTVHLRLGGFDRARPLHSTKVATTPSGEGHGTQADLHHENIGVRTIGTTNTRGRPSQLMVRRSGRPTPAR